MDTCVVIGCGGGHAEYRIRKLTTNPRIIFEKEYPQAVYWLVEERWMNSETLEMDDYWETKMEFTNPVMALMFVTEKLGWLAS